MSEQCLHQSFLPDRPLGIQTEFNKVSGLAFRMLILDLCDKDPVMAATLHVHDDYRAFDCRISSTGDYGYAVTPDRELTNVFSCVRGGGRWALENAMRDYDRLHLNCFEHTEKFYARAGFSTVRRESNWGDTDEMSMPDVVFMEWRKPQP